MFSPRGAVWLPQALTRVFYRYHCLVIVFILCCTNFFCHAFLMVMYFHRMNFIVTTLQLFQSEHIDFLVITVDGLFRNYCPLISCQRLPVSLQCTEMWEMLHTLLWCFVCRGTLQLLCGGGDMVEAILMQCPPLPDYVPILFFPFRSDSCWDWLLGDHIPGTKRAQLVWTGLSDTHPVVGVRVYYQCKPLV